MNLKLYLMFYLSSLAAVLMFVVIDMLPKYLSDVQDFQLINDGFVSGIPFLATLVSGCSACVFVGRNKNLTFPH